MKKLRTIYISFKSLGKNKLRSFLMMIGIIIGITAITIIVSMALGSRAQILERVESFGVDTLMIFGQGAREPGQGRGRMSSSLTVDDAVAIQNQVGNILYVAPFSGRWNIDIRSNGDILTTRLTAVTEDYLGVWNLNMDIGDFISDMDHERLSRVVVLGPTVKEELFPDEDPIGQTIRIENANYEIKGVLGYMGSSPGGFDMGNTVLIPLNTYMRRVANIENVHGIRIKVRNIRQMDNVVEEIKEVLRETHRILPGDDDDFSIITPTEVLEWTESVSETFDILLYIVAGISLIAGGVVVANIMLISVNERKFEIGLRKSVGAKKSDILVQFLFETIAVTTTGGIIGVLLGLGGALLFEHFGENPVLISWEAIAVGLGFSIIVGILSGIQPAKKASGMSPIEALRSK